MIVAPDKFKGSLTATEVARHITAGLYAGVVSAGVPASSLQVTAIPLADGGEGTVDAAVGAGWREVVRSVSGPTGDLVPASFARRSPTLDPLAITYRASDDDTRHDDAGGAALVEMAQASGLDRLSGGVPAPLTASTRGTGELVRAALDDGADEILLAVGGSASTDGGAGMLVALGARLLDGHGRDLPDGGGALRTLERVDLTQFDPRARAARWTLAADVDNPLLGPRGAAAVFGPQKGASAADVATLDAGLACFAQALAAACHHDQRAGDGWDARRDATHELAGAGAGGGIGLVALGLLGAVRRPGVEVVLELTGWAQRTGGASLVITGEGSLDAQSLGGKTPVGVAAAAARLGAPVVVLSGRRLLTEETWRAAGFADARALSDLEPDTARCIAEAGGLLERLAHDLGREIAIFVNCPDGVGR
ncbi:MAG: glycerate kinase [Janthinobacterium lividum]